MKKMAIHDVHDVGKQTTLINFNNHWKPGLQADFSGYSTQPILQRSRVVKFSMETGHSKSTHLFLDGKFYHNACT